MKIKRFVRQSLFFSFGLIGLVVITTSTIAEVLPDIETRQFRVTPVEKSKTGRVYRFKTYSTELPQTGRIILIEEQQKPIMAFRILKTDETTGEFIGKRVRRYDTEGELKLDVRYDSVEKVADLIAPPPAEPTTYDPNAKPELDANPTKNLLPPEGAPVPNDANPKPEMGAVSTAKVIHETSTTKPLNLESYDDDLDGSTSPQNLKEKGQGVETDEETSPETKTASEVEETTLINPFKDLISVSIGSYKNMSNFNLTASTASGFGANFSHLADRGLFIRGRKPQDSLSVEYGFEYYSRISYTGNNDDYTILPLKVQLRYDIHFSESFTYFLYFGVQYNWIMSTSGVDTTKFPEEKDAYNQLHGFQQTLGMGALFQIGPQWYIRADLGWDILALGLAVRW